MRLQPSSWPEMWSLMEACLVMAGGELPPSSPTGLPAKLGSSSCECLHRLPECPYITATSDLREGEPESAQDGSHSLSRPYRLGLPVTSLRFC